jgi:hypothetical protein
MRWTPEARKRIERVPSVLQGLVAGRVEEFARAKGRAEVTAELLQEARKGLGVGRGVDEGDGASIV